VNRTRIASAVAGALGVFMLVLDLTSGPSLSLLALDSTILLALTLAILAYLAFGRADGDGRRSSGQPRWTKRTPTQEMTSLVRAAEAGYTSSRREVARVLRSAVQARAGDEPTGVPHEGDEEALRSLLGDGLYAEFISEAGWNASRVRTSKGYITRLREAAAKLGHPVEG
jgi:hypothetical protein